MHARSESPGDRLLAVWRRVAPLPMGRILFMLAFARNVPYSGALGARIERLEPGFAQVSLRERRAVRNHLGSVHAIALANLGEMAGGLAMITALPAGVRAIVTRLEIDFAKKARGTLVAESRVTPPQVHGDVDCVVRAAIHDSAGDLVATVAVRWRLGLQPAAPAPVGSP